MKSVREGSRSRRATKQTTVTVEIEDEPGKVTQAPSQDTKPEPTIPPRYMSQDPYIVLHTPSPPRYVIDSIFHASQECAISEQCSLGNICSIIIVTTFKEGKLHKILFKSHEMFTWDS